MKKVSSLLAILFGIAIISTTAWGQSFVVDSFSDGDFTSNPTWTGDTGSWTVVTTSDVAVGATNSFTLRLNGPAATGTQHLSVQRTDPWGTSQSWAFWLGRRTEATGSNQSIVWLRADTSNLESTTISGYRILFGQGGADNIVLQTVVFGGAPTAIVTSTGTVANNLSDIGFMVRVIRTSASEWTLFTSTLPTLSGTGATALSEPSAANTTVNQNPGGTPVTDTTVTTFDNGFMGFVATHSGTGTNPAGAEFDQLFFDTSSDSPLPVELASFTTKVSEGRVILKWVTASESQNLGFNVYRSTSPDGPFTKLNPQIIPGLGTSGTGQEYLWVDDSVDTSVDTYYYYLKDVSLSGIENLSSLIQVNLKRQLVGPKEPALLQNYPNSFNPETWMPFQLSEAANVTLSIYNVAGKLVRTLELGQKLPGYYLDKSKAAYWDGRNSNGERMGSGVYFYSIRAGDFTAVRRMVLRK